MSNWRNLLRNLALKERSREKRPEAGRCKVKAGVWFFFLFQRVGEIWVYTKANGKNQVEKKVRFLRGLLYFTEKARRQDGSRCKYISQQKDKEVSR